MSILHHDVADQIRQVLQGIRTFWLNDCKPAMERVAEQLEDQNKVEHALDTVDDDLVVMAIFFVIAVATLFFFFFTAIQKLVVSNRCRCVEMTAQLHRLQHAMPQLFAGVVSA